MMASAVAHAASALNGIIIFASSFWWLLLFSGVRRAIASFFLGAREFCLQALEHRHERRLEIIRARRGGQLPVGVREDGSVVTVSPAGLRPGPCPHRPKNVKAVMGTDGELKSWLCTACDTPLPAGWAVLEEDL